jgi:hypothetical protein
MVLRRSACNCSQRMTDNSGVIVFISLFSLLVIVTEGVSTRSQPPQDQPSTKNVSITETTTPNLGARPNFQAKLETWAAQQHNLSRPTLILRPKYGLGNQMLSLVSGIALALVADRRLVVAWEGPFRFLLDPPFHLPEGPTSSSGVRAAVHFTAHSPGFPAAARALACGDVDGLLAGRVVEVEADQFFLPLVLLSPQVALSSAGKEAIVQGGVARCATGRPCRRHPAHPLPAPPLPPRLARSRRAVTPGVRGRARAGSPRPDSARRARRGARWRRCSRRWRAGSSGPRRPSGPHAPARRPPDCGACLPIP